MTQNKQLTRNQSATLIQTHFCYSNKVTYENIYNQEMDASYEAMDLTRMLKHHYIQLISQFITHEQRTALQKAVLTKHIKMEAD